MCQTGLVGLLYSLLTLFTFQEKETKLYPRYLCSVCAYLCAENLAFRLLSNMWAGILQASKFSLHPMSGISHHFYVHDNV